MTFFRIVTRAAVFACFFLTCTSPGFAQQKIQETFTPLSGEKVSIDAFDWTFNDSGKRADVVLTVTNHATLSIKKISISLTGQDEHNMMLQSDAHTISQQTSDTTLAPQETKQIRFTGAYNNESLRSLKLNQAIVEFSNGSLEVLH